VLDILKDKKFFQFDGRLEPFLAIYLLRMLKTAIFLFPVQFLTVNLKFLSSDFYSTMKFGGACGKF